MTPDRWKTVTALFDKAVALPLAQRDAFLVAACGQDASLLSEVRSLLDVHTDDPDYLEASAWEQHGEVIEDAIEGQVLEDRVGAYRLLRKIGSGGMGSVYLAERDDDAFRKRVAIKFIRGGAIRENAIKRFRRERQILARLEHPGIARLLDGGTTDKGTPYFVMEYVEGKPILDYCDEMGMGVRSRVELFLKVCEAVEYAHERLIVHRDLKASNILVDENGTPKLLDFGIAKVLQSDEEGQLTLTQTGLRQFTPDYASPEQVRGDQVTTATDVYSLGVLLYELLVGRRPFRFRNASPMDILQVLLESEPVRPSVAVGRREEADDRVIRPEIVVWHRRTDIRTLTRALAGDLDNVILKSLAKNPAERYRTAAALARDLHAYLEGHIVSAQKVTLAYRAAKFLKRHTWQTAIGLTMLGLLVGALLLALWQWREARQERLRAEHHSQQAREVARSLLFDLHGALAGVPGAMEARRMLLSKATQFLEDLAVDSSNDPAMQLELASAYRRLAQVQGDVRTENVGDLSGAAMTLQKALAQAEPLLGNPAYRGRAARTVVDILVDLSMAFADLGRKEEAAEARQRLAELLRELEKQAGDPMVDLARGVGIRQQASDAVQAGDNAQGRQLYQQAKGILEPLAAREEVPGDARVQYALVLKRLGALSITEKRLPEAHELYSTALAIERELLAKKPDDAPTRFDLSFTLSDLGYIQRENGRLNEAIRLYQEALQIREAALKNDPANQRAVWGVASTLNYLGAIYRELGWFDQALNAYERSLQMREDQLQRTPESRTNAFAVAKAKAGLAETLLQQAERGLTGQPRIVALQRARNLLQQAIPVFEEREAKGELIGADIGQPAALRLLLTRAASL